MTASAKLLIVVLDNLGDTVMASAVLRPLKRARPDLFIGLFVKRYAADALADHPLIDRLHAADPVWDISPGQTSGAWAPFVRTIVDIRRERYDAALILNTEWRRALATWLVRVPSRIGYDRRHAAPFLTTAVDVMPGVRHFIDDHRRLLESWEPSAAGADFVPSLHASPADRAWWENWRRSNGWSNENVVAIHPFSGDERKNWPLPSWQVFVERMNRERSCGIVVLAAAAEQSRLEAWMSRAGTRVRFLVGVSLREVKAVVSGVSLLVGGDSGLGHMAAALGTPVLSLFGPGDPARSGPAGPGLVQIIRRNPLATLSVDDVIPAALELLLRAETFQGR